MYACDHKRKLYQSLALLFVSLFGLAACRPEPKFAEAPNLVGLHEILLNSDSYYGHRLQVAGVLTRTKSGSYVLSSNNAGEVLSSNSELELKFDRVPDPNKMATCENRESVAVGILEQVPALSLQVEYLKSKEDYDKWTIENCYDLVLPE